LDLRYFNLLRKSRKRKKRRNDVSIERYHDTIDPLSVGVQGSNTLEALGENGQEQLGIAFESM